MNKTTKLISEIIDMINNKIDDTQLIESVNVEIFYEDIGVDNEIIKPNIKFSFTTISMV